MSRLALRYYLPIVQLVLLLGMAVSEQVNRYEAAHQPPQTVGWDIRSHGGRPNLFAEAFTVLNKPVFLAVLPLDPLLQRDSGSLFNLAIFFAIFVFWYAIGRSIDRFRGLLPTRPFLERGALWRRFAWITLSVSASGLALGIFFLFHSDEFANLYAYPLLVWAGLAALNLFSELRRPRPSSESLTLNLD